MFFATYYRWSDNDRRFGPFLYAHDARYRPFAVMLMSGDDDEPEYRGGCKLRLSAFGHTLLVAMPPILRPWNRKVYPGAAWDAETVKRLGRDWYIDSKPREVGFSYCEGFLQIHFGAQTHDSSTTMDWCKHLPWTQWRHVRHSVYDLKGAFWADVPETLGLGRQSNYNAWKSVEEACPSQAFAFKDFDGEALTARTRIEEREWRFGTGWFKWLSVFRAPKVTRSLNIEFSGETGKRKGSWKGGTMGTGIEMLSPDELHEAAFRRYCAEHDMTFEGSAVWVPRAVADHNEEVKATESAT
jgi:hypothetical protein